MQEIASTFATAGYKKIDRGIDLVISRSDLKQNFVTGLDKFLKKYDLAADPLDKIDFKKPPIAPNDELKSHSLKTVCFDFDDDGKNLITGGRDGAILIRNMKDLSDIREIKAHGVSSLGTTAICMSKSHSVIYSAGGDGSILITNIGNNPLPNQPIPYIKPEDDPLDALETLVALPVNEIQLFKDIMIENFNQAQAAKKEQFKKQIMIELNVIKQRLQELLKENERVTDIERLERDEFIVDISKQTEFLKNGEDVCEEIRKEAEKTNLRLELMKEKVQQNTWDKMEVQQKAVVSIAGDTMVFNYSIRKKTPVEHNLLRQITIQRKIELREKYARMEKAYKESLDELEFSVSKEPYFMNRNAGKPDFLDDDSIMQAAAEFAAKDAEKKARKDKEELAKLQANKNDQGEKRKPYLKITKGRLGAKTKKKDPDEEARLAAKDKMQQRDIRGMEEMHWKVINQKLQLEELKQTIEEGTNIFDIIYDCFELYTDTRKRHQIEMLREVIFELKRDFNKEFDALETEKEEQGFKIAELNEVIGELQSNLGYEQDLFQPQEHLLENPKHIFNIDVNKDITVEKYLTKEQREKEEEERRKLAAREAALKGDNVA